MTTAPLARPPAQTAQTRAADPARSVWVTANAGSGKTRVLTDRVARLLLHGTLPDRILCLTYTKAAAAEMQNRLFARLGEWSMLPDDRLRPALAALGETGALDGGRLGTARTLFARAIDAPGGLRIQTIHAFCAALLRRFPLEAGISPRFAEMDDRSARLLRGRVLADLADRGAPAAVAALAAVHTGEDFDRLADEIAAARPGFGRPLDAAGARALFGVPEGESEARILADTFRGGEADLIAAVVAHMARGKDTDVRNANALAALALDPPGEAALRVMEGVFLYKANADPAKHFAAKIGSVPTKGTQAMLGRLLPPLQDLMRRVADARRRRVALAAASRTAALHGFAAAFLPAYAQAKAARGLLDFDDLILRAEALLTDPAVAPWVLWRLDGAIDHILVDEAQDTAPQQWRLVESLAAEFTAGQGAQDRPRTLFVVGDRKQSIYSFQGADLDAFDRQQAGFAARFAAAGAPLHGEALEQSFRSAPAVLRLVDAVFAPDRGRGLDGPVRHVAHFAGMPGRVDLWPVIPPSENSGPGNWWDPVDLTSAEHHASLLADRIAGHIGQMLAERAPVPERRDGGGVVLRPVRAGDILILVRRRGDIFTATLRALKKANLPVAGADRLRLGAELAVRDILAVLQFLALPDDDLSLAAALRSPLFGWSEDALFRLANSRPRSLWEALRTNPGAPPDTLAILHDLRAQADFLRPHDLIARLLRRHDGRRRLLARLGAEAADGIDELLAQALAYETAEVPSLPGFLVWLDADDVEVRRQPEGAGDRIRLMTVHGAKGLEAPVVILPDCASPRSQDRDVLLPLPGGPPVWKTAQDDSPPQVEAALEARRAAEAAESLRLLYVAMTRAQSRLVVAAAGKVGKDDAGRPAWWHLVAEGMAEAGASGSPTEGMVLQSGDWGAAVEDRAAPAAAAAPALPGWIDTPVATPARRAPLSPSDLGGAKALAGEDGRDGAAARTWGTALHRLLELLPLVPQADWPQAAAAQGVDDPAGLLAEAAAVLRLPDAAAVFAPGTVAEAAIAGTWQGRPMLGSIDRLLVADDHVLAVDFKSNRVLPGGAADTPEGILRQMGAYAHMLGQVYPGRRIETAILWTRGPRLMPLPCDMVLAALQRATIP
jgi:ATP-dependent helicase/nuclease subunit A